MKSVFRSLKQGIILRFCFFTLFISLLYSLFCLIFMYVIEDNFIDREIVLESQRIEQIYQQQGQWPQVSQSYMQIYHGLDSFPDNIASELREEPGRNEFYGLEGRHYHLIKLETQAEDYLIAEVSQLLQVRPLRPYIFTVLGVVSLLLTCVACFMAYRIGRHMIQPLTDLAVLVDSAEPAQLPRQFAHRFPTNEIGQLANTLESSMERIRAFVAREQAFTRDASHELRTPVAIIKSSLALLKEVETSSQSPAVLMDRIHFACLNMEQSVSTLLSLAREETSNNNKQWFSLLPLVERTIVKYAHLLENKPVEVKVVVPSDVRLQAHQGTVEILLSNLLSNAFQYTHEGHVEVSWQDNHLQVSDTGPGVESTIREQVFDSQIKGSESVGMGMGLSIVKRLCEQQGLTVELSSFELGTKITIHF